MFSTLRSLVKSSSSSSVSARLIAKQSISISPYYSPNLGQITVLVAEFRGYGVAARPSYAIYRQFHSGPTSPVLKENSNVSSNGIVAPQQAVQAPEKHPDETLSTYWGITRKPVYRKDGSVWPWRSFMPWDTYTANTNVDLTRHHKMDTLTDKVAYWTVKTLRWPTDLFFQKRYGCRAMMLETVAAVPGVVAGMILHLRSLRRFEHSGGWIKALLEEAENERMHLMTFMEVSNPHWYERALVMSVQAAFFSAYLGLYVLNPRLAHRIVGYLEEEAIHSYTQFLHEIDVGSIENVPAPLIAIDYWRLPANARIRDVVEVVRADEAHHRDVNHFAADIYEAGKPLKDLPAPLGYH